MPNFARKQAKLIRRLRRRGIADERVLAAIGRVPRERFVPEPVRHRAYVDRALPVAAGQTISQPFVVALMTQMLGLEGEETVLEVGTGTGYQTAILAELARRVVSIERLPELAAPAEQVLDDLGYPNIEFHIGDGTLGWPEAAPYDAVLVTAGAPEVPMPLYNQLREGGRLVIPVGDEEGQMLTIVTRQAGGPQVSEEGGCRFVPLIGAAGWEVADSPPQE